MAEKFSPSIEALKITDLSLEKMPHANRAGIVPFVVKGDGSISYLMIKPQMTKDHPDGPPNFQIIRSEREVQENTHATGQRLEDPLQTALRSGRQEAGLLPGNIKKLYDLGVFTTRSREGGYSHTQLFGAQLHSTTELLQSEKSFGRGWKSPLADAAEMRDSHNGILRQIDSTLKAYLASGIAEVDVQLAARSASSNLERVLPVVDLTRGRTYQDTSKVGIIPFAISEKGGVDFMLMKPRATMGHPGGEPSFQIAKGTRVASFGKKSWDMGRQEEAAPHPPRVESYLETAIREGREELGLKASNIRRMFDMGVYSVNSETTGKSKEMHLFAAELKSGANFFSRPQPTTQEVRWFKQGEGGKLVKKSHMRILEDVSTKLDQWLSGEKDVRQK